MSPASDGSSGKLQRVGCVTENANRPPGRSTRAVSATATSMSATNCSAPKEQKTTSNEPSAERAARSRCRAPTGPRDRSPRRSAVSAGAGGRRGRGRRTRPPCTRTQREHWPAPEPTSSTSLPRDVAEDPGLVLGQPLGTPHEAGVAEEAAVGRLVLVGVPVPVGAVGPPRLRPRRPRGARPGRAAAGGPPRRDPTGLLPDRGCGSVTGVDFSALTPLAGGWSGQTFLAEAGGARSVVRIYPPGRSATTPGPRSTRPCCGWCAGWCRCPRCWRYAGGPPRRTGPGCWSRRSSRGSAATCCCRPSTPTASRGPRDRAGCPGRRPRRHADCCGPGASSTATCGSAVPAADGLPGFVDDHAPALGLGRSAARAARRRGRARPRRCSTRWAAPAWCTATSTPRTCSSTPDTLEVTGVLDWEFAHAGHPFTDLGNLLRFDRHPAYAEAVLAACASAAAAPRRGARPGPRGRPVGAGRPGRPGGREPGRRPGGRPAPRRSPRRGDLHAVPAGWTHDRRPRVDSRVRQKSAHVPDGADSGSLSLHRASARERGTLR